MWMNFVVGKSEAKSWYFLWASVEWLKDTKFILRSEGPTLDSMYLVVFQPFFLINIVTF